MDNTKKNKKSLLSDRRFKYGSLSVGLTAAFIALIVILNVVVYALAYSYGWYLDLTGTQYYGITEKSKRYLDEVLTDGVEIKIVFCQDKDRVLDDSAGYYVYKCAESYKEAYPDNIKIEYLDVVSHPDLAAVYTTQLSTPLYTYNVIIESNKSENFRLVNYDNFFTFDADSGSVYAFNGERRFTSYVLSLCYDYPICYFVTGHGETVNTSEGVPCAIYDMMTDAGFDVRTIDLKKEDISADAKVVIINDPIYDFMSGDEKEETADGENPGIDELAKLGRFMSDSGGNMLVFLSPEHQAALKNLKIFLGDWGIGVKDGQVTDSANSLTQDGLSIIADYPTGTDFAASLHYDIRQLDSQPYTVVKNAVALNPLFEARGSREVGTVLYSYQGSKLCTAETDKPGQYPIALLSRQSNVDPVTNQTVNTYMFVTSAGYADAKYIRSNSYGNRDIIYQLVSQMGKRLIPMDIDFKPFASEALDIPTSEAYAWTVTLSVVFPLIVCGIGIFVYVRRKRL